MKLLNVLVFALLYGIASADLWDYNNGQNACILSIPGLSQNLNYCDHIAELMTCLKAAAQTAKVENRKEVKAVFATFEDMCTDGTDSNKLYLANRECVKGAISDPKKILECYKELIDDLSKLTPEQRRDPKIVKKVTCKYAIDIMNCITYDIGAVCGPEAVKFLNALQGSSQRLVEQACIENDNSKNVLLNLFKSLQ